VSSYGKHFSVLLEESLALLLGPDTDAPDSLILDGTLGGGGHTFALLERTQHAHIIGLDQDREAIKNAGERRALLEPRLAQRISFCETNFSSPPEEIFQGKNLMGVLLDIGVSSHQFDEAERGFSFRKSGPLDMRMSQSTMKSAQDLLAELSAEELADLIYQYGEEHYSRQIARNIVAEREKSPITTTDQLENIVFHSYPAKLRHGRLHPATKTFQALRIAVNDELGVLERALALYTQRLALGGTLAVISFHSLEDRLVKHYFRQLSQSPQFALTQRRAQRPTEEEIELNGRSRSAKLRGIKRISL
jgi:16S rRNA (cytosine1402-N4)-methyltransferase